MIKDIIPRFSLNDFSRTLGEWGIRRILRFQTIQGEPLCDSRFERKNGMCSGIDMARYRLHILKLVASANNVLSRIYQAERLSLATRNCPKRLLIKANLMELS